MRVVPRFHDLLTFFLSPVEINRCILEKDVRREDKEETSGPKSIWPK